MQYLGRTRVEQPEHQGSERGERGNVLVKVWHDIVIALEAECV